MSKPAVLIRKSTGEILKHCPYPREDMAPVENLDADLEYLLKHTPYQSPDYDPRIWELEISEPDLKDIVANNQLDQLPPHPEHPGVRAFEKKYKTKKRSDEEINRAIDNAEEAANRELLNQYRTDEKLFMLGIGILVRKDAGVQPSADEQAILDEIMAFDVPMWKNDKEKKNKKEQVANGIEPEIDAGWQKNK